MSKPTLFATLAALAVAALPGCGSGVDSTYGRSRDRSINGTGVLAEMFRARGHTVRTAVRLTGDLAEWADAIVRFAPDPGAPEAEEAEWYNDWLYGHGGRRLIYVPRDYRANRDYWSDVLARLPKDKDRSLRERAEKLRDEVVPDFAGPLSKSKKKRADKEEWFGVKAATGPTRVVKALEGPWAEGIDAAGAALSRHETIDVGIESVLLKGDGEPLVIEWSLKDDSGVLVAANGSFLLNETLVNAARRPLALRAVDWVGEGPLNVAFVEGSYILNDVPTAPSVFALLRVPPFGWVAAQLLVLGLAACLARAPRLGRPRPEPPTGEDRPAAHPEALGALLARTGQAADARAILETYRRWRWPSRHP